MNIEKEYVEGLLRKIERLQAERDELAAKNLIMRSHLQIAHDCINGADETGYVDDVGFVDFEALSLDLKALIESTPQQCLRDVQAEAAEKAIQAVLKLPTFTGQKGNWLIKSIAWDEVLPFAKKYAAKVRHGGAE